MPVKYRVERERERPSPRRHKALVLCCGYFALDLGWRSRVVLFLVLSRFGKLYLVLLGILFCWPLAFPLLILRLAGVSGSLCLIYRLLLFI